MREICGVCVVAIAVGIVACTVPGRREAAALEDAVDRFRRAESSQRAWQARQVGALPCSDAAVCEAKRVCVAAIEPTAEALAIKDEVTARLGDLEHKRLAPDAPEAQALPEKLDQATRLLGEGRAKMADCDSRLVALHVHFGG
jgi:hypothetical protein